MPEFSKTSLDRLSTVHPDLQTLFQIVVKDFDCTVVSGLRTTAEQQALYAKGRPEGNIVTYKDGIEKLSRHQGGNAVDVVPYFKESPHIRWDDKEAFVGFGNFVLGVATMLKEYGAIDKDITWGGQWEWKDFPHFQI